jgi:hypothetical protein
MLDAIAMLDALDVEMLFHTGTCVCEWVLLVAD